MDSRLTYCSRCLKLLMFQVLSRYIWFGDFSMFGSKVYFLNPYYLVLILILPPIFFICSIFLLGKVTLFVPFFFLTLIFYLNTLSSQTITKILPLTLLTQTDYVHNQWLTPLIIPSLLKSLPPFSSLIETLILSLSLHRPYMPNLHLICNTLEFPPILYGFGFVKGSKIEFPTP